MNIQTVATKLLLKLPQPILNKLMRSVPKNNKNVKNTQKPWHLKGNWAPVEKELEVQNLEVIGDIPKEISGKYIRNGMNPVSGYRDHWFFFNVMIHSVEIENGTASNKNK